LAYNAPKGSATIYVYGTCAPDDAAATAAEAERAAAIAISMSPDAKTPWPFGQRGPFYGRFFLAGDTIGFSGVSAKGGRFIKVRFTFDYHLSGDPEMAGHCLHAICNAIEGQQTSWTGA